jgi:hypothetical protein
MTVRGMQTIKYFEQLCLNFVELFNFLQIHEEIGQKAQSRIFIDW